MAQGGLRGFIRLDEFIRLSAVLTFQHGIPDGKRAARLLDTVLGGASLSDADRRVLRETVDYALRAYGDRRRKVGTLAVLHPLRTAALLAAAHAPAAPKPLDVMAAVLHDKLEDLTRRECGSDEEWAELEQRYRALLRRIEGRSEWFLAERLEWLTRRPGEDYCAYTARVVEHAAHTPELGHVKLCDKLDNCCDMRLELKDPLEGVDFYERIVTLFISDRDRPWAEVPHPPASPIPGWYRLFTLYKSVVLLSLLRMRRAIAPGDRVGERLFRAVAEAGAAECMRIVIHLLDLHCPPERRRAVVAEAMEYCAGGGVRRVTAPGAGGHRLDGLLLAHFADPDPKARNRSLERLYADKELMVGAGLAFLAIFRMFVDDPDFFLEGITAAGVAPPPPGADAAGGA